MSDALRRAGAHVDAPSDAQRQAFVAQLAQHFPELSKVASSIKNPRAYVPPPVVPAPAQVVENEGVSIAKPPEGHIATPQRVPSAEPPPPPAETRSPTSDAPPMSTGVPAPPAFVDPKKVKYDE